MGTMTKEERKASLLNVGAKLAAKHGAINVTRRMVAQAAKVTDSLVSHHFGSTADAQKVYARQARKLGLVLPDAKKAAAIGSKLRAHGPRAAAAPRKRSVKEVKAIKGNQLLTAEQHKARVLQAAKRAGLKVAPQTVDEQAIAGNAARKVINRKPAPEQNKALPGPEENKEARLPAPPPEGVPLQ